MASRFDLFAMEMDATEFAAGPGMGEELLDRAMAAANSILAQGDPAGPAFMVDRLEVVQAPAGFGAEQCQYRTVCQEVRVCNPDGTCRREVRCFRECVG
jgi:hypothetical protein